MPLIDIPGKGLVEFPYSMSPDEITAAVRKLAGPAAEERPPGPGVPAGEGALKPTFWQALGGSMKERAGEIGQMPGDVAQRVGQDAKSAYGSLPELLGMLPGLQGVVGAGMGHLAKNKTAGEPLDFKGAGVDAGLASLGFLGKLGRPLSKLRIAGTGKAGDARLAADAVRGAGTALQPGGTAAELMDTMRGVRGERVLGSAKGAAEEAIAKQLPPAPPPIDKTTREYLDATVSRTAPPDPVAPALSREGYQQATGDLTKLGRQGFNLRGLGRDSPSAVAAREQYGEQLGSLKGKVEEQGGPGLLGQMEKGRRDFSAGQELRRLFRGNVGEGPDRVFRPGGFNLQDVQERAGKRVGEIQGRLGQESGDELLRKLYRGGKPGTGTDRPLALSGSKFGGWRIPTGLEIKAGPGLDPRLLQLLLQGGGLGMARSLDQ